MRLLSLKAEPFYSLPYKRARSRRSGRGIEVVELPFYTALVDLLPAPLEALVLASDLQGRLPSTSGYPGELLGIGLARQLSMLSQKGLLPDLDRVGVLLAGDLYTVPGLVKRGGLGDVREVWWTLGNIARWAVGVPGNHDDFGTDNAHLPSLSEGRSSHVLDQRVVTLDGLRIAGVAGIVGNPRKTWHRPLKEHLRAIQAMLAEQPDILVLHEGPRLKKVDGQRGIRRSLERNRHGCLVLCGHRHWRKPLVDMGKCQVLNLEARVVVLREKS